MNEFLIISLLILSFPVFLFFPGFALLNKVNLRPKEYFPFSIVLSIIVLSLFWYLRFIFVIPEMPVVVVLTTLSIASVVFNLKKFFECLRDLEFRTILISYLLIFSCIVFASFQIKVFSGGWWYGDWHEHYERSVYFSSQPENVFQLFLGMELPARPPLFNIIASFFLWIFGEEFYLYQVVSCLLNSLVFFPLVLLFDKQPIRKIIILSIFLICNPYFMQNTTYTWTKFLSAFFVAFSLWSLLEYLKKKENFYFNFSVICMALGVLSHYLAVVYAAVVFAYLIFSKNFKLNRFGMLSRALLLSVMALAPWFFWSIYIFDPQTTFLQNTAVIDAAGLGYLSNIVKCCFNLFSTIVPMYFWGWIAASSRPEFTFTDLPLVVTRDYWFFHYQHNLMFSIGSVLWVLVLWRALKLKFAVNCAYSASEKFWIDLIPSFIILGVLVHGGACYFGLSHICLSPVVLLGIVCGVELTLSASKFIQTFIFAGLLFDFLFGVLLHFYVQSYFVNTGNALLKNEKKVTFLADLL